jgi:hypothetical protein
MRSKAGRFYTARPACQPLLVPLIVGPETGSAAAGGRAATLAGAGRRRSGCSGRCWFDAGAPWRPALLEAVPPLVTGVASRAPPRLAPRPRESPARRASPGPPSRPCCSWSASPCSSASRSWSTLPRRGSLPTAPSRLGGDPPPSGRGGPVFPEPAPGGTLKSHLAAPSWRSWTRPALALVSVAFYALSCRPPPPDPCGTSVRGRPSSPLSTRPSPVSLTCYSLNNDGTYIEVLALGTWALWLSRAGRRTARGLPSRPRGGRPARRPSGATSSPSSTSRRASRSSSSAAAGPASAAGFALGSAPRAFPALL